MPTTARAQGHSMAGPGPSGDAIGFRWVAWAFLAHAAGIATLIFGGTWPSRQETPVIAAELWSQTPLPNPVPTAVPPVTPAAAAPTPSKPDITTERLTQKQKPPPPRHQPASPPPHAQTPHEQQRERSERELARQDQLKRMARLANGASPAGTHAAESSATATGGQLSASYAARIKARIRPNIVWPHRDAVTGNPAIEVEIRVGPDGTILQPIRVLKKSGNDQWDTAVLRGIERTGSLPRDGDGRYPSPLILIHRPNDP